MSSSAEEPVRVGWVEYFAVADELECTEPGFARGDAPAVRASLWKREGRG
jgi:hypothetical protein